REHALLHLAGVLGAKNDELTILEAQADASLGVDAGGEAVGRKGPGVDDDEIRLAERVEFLLRGAGQHRVHEKGVVGAGADDVDLDAVLRVPAGEAIETVEALPRV